MSTTARPREAWLEVLAELKAPREDSDDPRPWRPPTHLGPPPADILDQLLEVRAALREAIKDTSAARAAAGRHLAGIRSAAPADAAPRYLDIEG